MLRVWMHASYAVHSNALSIGQSCHILSPNIYLRLQRLPANVQSSCADGKVQLLG
jgi:hypothetical protein